MPADSSGPGAVRSSVTDLARLSDRITFIYLEQCTVHRQNNAITATNKEGTVHIPSATLLVLLLGPGTRVSHQAMLVLADSGATAIWVGEQGVRFYAAGRSLARSSHLLQAQAKLVSNTRTRLDVARAMYQMRFPNEDVSKLTMQQLRGREGSRVRKAYRECSTRFGIEWSNRSFDPNDYDSSDTANQALSAATTCLYGLAHAIVVALGCSPGLGFVHTGHDKSFVYDIADLYKVQYAIPTAFEVAADGFLDVGGTTRRLMRDIFYNTQLTTRMVTDIQRLLQPDSTSHAASLEADIVQLWDDAHTTVPAGTAWSDEQ